MIQRKQTLWLLLAAILTALCFVLPYGLKQSTNLQSTTITEIPLKAQTDIWSMALCILSVTESIAIVFLFKNRSLQMKLILVNILSYLATVVYLFINANNQELGHKLVIGLVGNQFYIGFLLPIISILFLVLAFSGVKSDQDLIKSVDRLR
ncbi:MAG: DUF4293 family protein [Niabella sp.]|nr:MAG: DUF4293 family protein [Niabella sp.]